MNLPELNHSPDTAETENMGVERDGVVFRERRVGLIENTASVGENLYAGFPPSSQRITSKEASFATWHCVWQASSR